MNGTPIFCLDVDGVLLDLHTEWANEFNRRSGQCITEADMTDWYWDKKLSPDLRKVWWAARTPDIYDHTEPVPGAIEGVRELRKYGHLVIVTHDEPHFVTSKVRRIHLFFPCIRDIVFAKNKRSVVPTGILIDDAAHNQPDVLLNRPWNRRECAWPGCRAANWVEAVDVALYLAGAR